jgi:hypothetical protein
MAYMGHWLHFSFEDMLKMDLSDFLSFTNEMKESAENSNHAS